MRCPVSSKNNRAKDTKPNNEPQTKPKRIEIINTLANEDIANRNVVRGKEIKPNAKPHKTNDENNSKLYAKNCGYTEHTARECRHRRKEASAYRGVPYQKQDTENNKQFRKYIKKTYKTVQINEASEQLDQLTSSGSEDEQSVKQTRHAIYNKKLTKVR